MILDTEQWRTAMSVRSLFDEETPATANESSPLCEKYRPRRIAEFIGLEKPKRVLQKYSANPFDMAWLFVGPTGTGKTAMALALATEIAAKVHLMPAPGCTREKLDSVCEKCMGFPGGKYKKHLVLVDQADRLSQRIQTDLRSGLEGVSRLQDVVWVFTAATSDGLDPGFVSRCMKVTFSTYGISKEAAAFLENIWDIEVPDRRQARPNFARIVKESNNDIRTALNRLETNLMNVSS
jgi:replication-associated recombination protein RarA